MTTSAGRPDTSVLARTWANPPGFIGWLAQVNHKAVGLRFVVTGFVFFVLAGIEALRMRTQLAVPENTFLESSAYSAAFSMHGTAMMFLFAVPIMEGVAIYLVPLMIGARDMALPRLNAFGYWVFLISGVSLFVASFAGMSPDTGWYAYSPLSLSEYSPHPGMDFWATMITFIEIAALVAAVELIVTIFKQRAPGMALNRMPIFVWAALVTAFMIVFAMPPLMIGSVFMALDRKFGTHFYNAIGGGDPLLWQHLFWFFGHPDVYIILVPALGMISAIIVVAARRSITGYTAVVLSLIGIGFVSFGLWVHHMFTTGIPVLGMSFFSAASMMITIPSGILVFCWVATIWNGRVAINTAFLFVIGAIVTFVLGGVTGVMLASVPFNIQAHDSFFVVAHFHYVLFGGVVFPLFAAFHHWHPKVTGRRLSETLGRWSFWVMLTGFHITFFPQHILGFQGMPRRVFTYLEEVGWGSLNLISTIGAFITALGVLLFIVNVVRTRLLPVPAGDQDPWHGDTLEWATSSPPQMYNFDRVQAVRARHPRWDDTPDSGAGQPPMELRDDRRETPATSLIDAVPESRLVLPGPTLLPLFTALAVGFTFLGLIAHVALVAVGALATFALLVTWNWPGDWQKVLTDERVQAEAPDDGKLGREGGAHES